ncbi:hypothetical protein [Aurantiacibacter gangjinensis]|uniref:Uncharacterized protein n=1 Tax=Aurantiacibacter gangjinensis TaxID=502682 RepID=A0A0G9MQ79_9SPHN|nr:hypothetical protein [Aurantiacibacter gangjinensis]KLE32892.1 hypothetical protein AAW01_02420 [Aurantiacibacter gangjinensis]
MLPIIALAPLLVANQDAPEVEAPTADTAALTALWSAMRNNCDDVFRNADVEAPGADAGAVFEGEAVGPLIQRRPAEPGAVPHIKAVDLTMDGCAMMLTNSGEWQPLPEFEDGLVDFEPAQ